MKVILKTKINKLGNIGDVVVVKDGYARNLLLPSGKAMFYNDKNYEFFKVKKDEIAKQNNEKKIAAEELKTKISVLDLVLIENAGDDGKLYGSISTVKLANFINSLLKNNILKKTNVFIKNAIKTIGKFSVTLELHSDVVFDVVVVIARTKEEAIKIKKGELILEDKDAKSSDDFKAEEVTLKAPSASKKKKQPADSDASGDEKKVQE